MTYDKKLTCLRIEMHLKIDRMFLEYEREKRNKERLEELKILANNVWDIFHMNML